jgi:hypothetical protein
MTTHMTEAPMMPEAPMLMTEAPWELFAEDGIMVPAVGTVDGELLARVGAVPAGPWLAVLIGEVDRTRLTPFDLPSYLTACQRLRNWVDAQLCAGVAELAARPGPTGPDKETALALKEPVGASQTRIWQAMRVTRWLPRVWRRWADGDLSDRHVQRLLEATAPVEDPEMMAKVEDRVLDHAVDKTAAELARYARRTVERLDPDAAQRRARDARDKAGVSLHPGEDGMADVVMHAGVEDATVVKTGVDAYAAAAKSCGDQRAVGVLRAEAVTRWASAYLTGLADGHIPKAAGRPVEVGITVSLRTALGLDDLPGEIPGVGLVPREVIADMIRDELPRLRLLVIDDHDGRLLHRAEADYRPTPAQAALVRGKYLYSIGPGSQVLATRTDTDHVISYPTGPTQVGNLLPLDRTWHRGKTNGQLAVSVDDRDVVTITSRTGQTRTLTPYDYRATDPDQHAASLLRDSGTSQGAIGEPPSLIVIRDWTPDRGR